MITPEKNTVQFVKLNRFVKGIPFNPSLNIIYLRATEIASLYRDGSRNCTVVSIKGVNEPIAVVQTPDEMLALMKDDNASMLGNSAPQLIIKTDDTGNMVTPIGAPATGRAA